MSFSWSSSNSKIAKVKNGKVTGLKPDTAKITAKVKGKKSSCTITVKKKSSSAATLYKAFPKKGTFQIPYSYSVGGRKYTSYTTMQIQSFAYVDTNGDKKPELYVRAYKKGKIHPMRVISYSYLYNGPSTQYTKEVEYFYNTKRAYSAQHYLRTGNVVYRQYTSSYIAELRSSREFYSWYRTNANNGKGYQIFVFLQQHHS